jgi:ABC-type transport system involved in cytochrome c biogenesis ATPase subunit
VPRLQVRELQSPLAGPYSFELQAGQCLTIRGRSGAGKSLLLRMLCSLAPSTGEVLLDGAARSITDERQRLRLERLTSR